MRLRPAGCSVDNIPPKCADNTVWPHAGLFPYAFDASYPNYASGTDFLAKIGIDVEVRDFNSNKKDAKGIFSFFWDMDKLLSDPNRSSAPGDPVAFTSDAVGPMDNFKLPDTSCAKDADNTQGFFWKKGYDLYCSGSWPYDICAKNSGTACEQDINGEAFPSSCGCTPENAAQWPEDGVDDVVYGFKEFYNWSNKLAATPDVTQLKINMEQWYPEALSWVGEVCNADNSNASTCYSGAATGGRLRLYRDRVGRWQPWLDAWRTATTYTDANAWCVPPSPVDLPKDEKDYIAARSTEWGSIDSVTACLAYNKDNDTRFQTCLTDLNKAISDNCPTTIPAIPTSCYDHLPRSLLGAFPLSDYDPCEAASDYVNWVTQSRDLAANTQKDKFAQREVLLKGMKDKALTAALTVAAFKTKLDDFLDGSVVQALFNAYNSVTNNPPNKLQNYVIYGWRDFPKRHGQKAYWHIVRAEVKAPGNCPGGGCGTDRLAWVRSYTKGFLGMTRCYELTDHTGKVYATATRWDEDHYFPIYFANKFLLWQATFNKPGSPVETGDVSTDIDTACGNLKGLGLNDKTKNALRDHTDMNTTDEKKIFSDAFMLNQPGGECWELANRLLNKGVSSQTCAQYFLNGNHIDIKFVKCQE